MKTRSEMIGFFHADIVKLIMKKTRIKIPIYTGWIYIFLFNDEAELLKSFPEEKDTSGWCRKDGGYSYIMILHRNVKTSTLVHESNHITNMIFDYHGVRLDTKNDEHQTYFLTWVFEEVEKYMKKNPPIVPKLKQDIV